MIFFAIACRHSLFGCIRVNTSSLAGQVVENYF